MKKNFYHTDFLLTTATGKQLYHSVAAGLPIIDPHNHLDPAAMAVNKKFDNVYTLWVQHDPYKHRAMRICGIPEDLITGDRPVYEKFAAWAGCLPATAGNPLFHWSFMELKEMFGIDEMLSAKNCAQIWQQANDYLQQHDVGAMDMLKKFSVEMLCTSDDFTDTLENHATLAKNNSTSTCLPSLRSDSLLAFDQPGFHAWLQKLQHISGISITDLNSYKDAINRRLDIFDAAGCLLSDHSLDSGFSYLPVDDETAETLFSTVLQQQPINQSASVGLQSHLLLFLGKAYARRNWKMQLHIGAYRYTNSNLRSMLGPAGGYACIGTTADVQSLCRFLDDLDKALLLPKTILYTLNPADNAVLASLTGSYAQDDVQGKIQYGAAWWYNDHYEGIREQLKTLSNYGLLSTSIGMTTDSRSLLSFIRHGYYRRILCNFLGEQVDEGRLPDDWQLLADMVSNICYHNCKNWLKK